MGMKAKKLYTGALYRDLTHEKAKCYCLQNPDFVITRREWDGYHFIKDGDYFIMLKEGILLNCGSCLYDLSEKVYDIDKKDWITAHRSEMGVKKESKAPELTWKEYQYYCKKGFKVFEYHPYFSNMLEPVEDFKLPPVHGFERNK